MPKNIFKKALIALFVVGALLIIAYACVYVVAKLPKKPKQNNNANVQYLQKMEEKVAKLSQVVEAQNNKIETLSQAIKEINTINISKERYALIAVTLANLMQNVYSNSQTVAVSQKLTAISTLASKDITLTTILKKINGIKTVHSVQYFKYQFPTIVKTYKQPNVKESKFIAFVEKHISPYFAYISPNGSRALLFRAESFLQNNDVTNTYKALVALPNKTKEVTQYLQNLEELTQLMQALTEAINYIEVAASLQNASHNASNYGEAL